MRHLLVSLSIAVLAAGCFGPDPRFSEAHHENAPGGTQGGWQVAVSQFDEVSVITWSRSIDDSLHYYGTMSVAGRQRMKAASQAVVDDWVPFDECADPAGKPCTTYWFATEPPHDGSDHVVAVRTDGDLTAFVQDLVDQVPTGSSAYVDDIH